MRVLVSGANGFLAGHVIHCLVKEGYLVRGMMRGRARAPALEGLEIEIFRGDITHNEQICQAVEGCDLIIHIAADTRQSGRHWRDYEVVNIQATRQLLEAGAGAGVKRFVYVSTANTMGYGSAVHPGTEDLPPDKVFMRSGYAHSKWLAEQHVQSFSKHPVMKTLVVNPGFMIGPMDHHAGSGKIFSMIEHRRIVFYPPGGKSFVDVRDVAQATVNALKLGESGSRFLLSGTNMSYHDFFRLTNSLSGGSRILLPLPAWTLYLAGMAGSLISSMGFRCSLHLNNAKILCLRNFYDHSKAVRELSMPVTDIRKTIQDALAWRKTRENHLQWVTNRRVIP